MQVDESDAELAKDLGAVSPIRGTLRLMRTSAGILVTGELSLAVRLECGRCLEPFTYEQQLVLNEEFLPTVDVDSGTPLEEPVDSEAFTIRPDHVLDLTEAIRQLAILETPIKPVCRDDCAGLCPECGANLNAGPCGCRGEHEEGPSGSFGSLLAERLREAGFKPEQE